MALEDDDQNTTGLDLPDKSPTPDDTTSPAPSSTPTPRLGGQFTATPTKVAQATPATPPAPYQAPPDQPGRVGPDQSPRPLAPGGSAAPPTPAVGPFGPFGLPQFRAAPRQSYIPAMANRPPHMWGEDRQHPMMPKMWEVPGMYRGLGRKLSQWGPRSIAPFAAMMGQHSGAWMMGYMQGQEQLARMNHQRMTMAAQETEKRLGEQMREYQQIHAIFGDDPKNADKLHQALENAANKYQDDHMLSALHTAGPGAAERLLQWYDAQHSDLRASNKTRAADEAQRDALAPFQLHPTDQTGLPRATPATPPEGATEPAETPETGAPAAGAPGAEPTTGNPDVDSPKLDLPADTSDSGISPEGAGQTAAAEPTPPAGDEQGIEYPPTAMGGDTMSDAPPVGMRTAQAGQPPAQRNDSQEPVLPQYDPQNSPVLQQAAQGPYHLDNSPLLDAEAQKMVMGTSKMTPKSNRVVYDVVSARAREIELKLNGIAESNLSPAAARHQIQKVLPQFLGQLEGYVSGQNQVPSGGRNLPMMPYIISLGHKLDPGWNEQTAKVRFAKMKDMTSGAGGRRLLSGVTSMDHLDHLQELSDKLPYWYGPGRKVNQAIQGYLRDYAPEWITPEDWQKDANAIIEYEATLKLVAPEVERAQKGAAGTKGENEDYIRTMSSDLRPEQRRQNIGSARTLIWQRTKNDVTSAAAAMGVRPETLLNPYDRFHTGGGMSDNGKAEDGSAGNSPVPTRSGFDFSGTARRMLTQPPPRAGAAPAGPSRDDQEAISWARAHPGDRRAQDILRANGMQ